MITDKERFLQLVTRKLSGNLSHGEEREMEETMKQFPELEEEYSLLSRFWRTPEEEPSEAYVATVYEEVQRHLHHRREAGVTAPANENKRIGYRRLLHIAAAILLCVAAGGAAYLLGARQEPAINIKPKWVNFSTRKGERKQLTLSDGTKVWLNVDSRLQYPKVFEGNERKVFLTGEAFFEVTHDPASPFCVATKSMMIKDIGTAFDVKSYPGGITDEATLVHGAIEITLKNNAVKTIMLKPNEKMVVRNRPVSDGIGRSAQAGDNVPSPKLPIVSIVEARKMNGQDSSLYEDSWMENKLVFRDEDFVSLAMQLERWYDVEIEINNDAVKQYRFSGIFTNETVRQALQALQITEPFTYHLHGNKIIINH